MAKRTRGSSRPGQRRPTQRPAARPGPSAARPIAAPTPSIRPSGALTAEEEARAAELEERIVAEEKAAALAERQARERSRQVDLVGSRREAVPLAVKAAGEYAYVRRDIVRISRIAALLFLALAVLHVLINVMGVISV